MADLSKRKASLDYIRITALALVLLIHSAETVWPIDVNGLSAMPVILRIFVLTLFNLGRLSVPLFLFLTGYLMLGRQYRAQDVWAFYRTKVFRLLSITWIWTTIYFLFGVVSGRHNFDLILLIQNLLFINTDWLAPHLWYMPVIIILYLLIPFIANIIQSIDRKVLTLLLGCGVGYAFVVPLINVAIQAGHNKTIVSISDGPIIGVMPLVCGLMMTCGYLVRRYWLAINRIRTMWIVLLAAIGFTLMMVYHYVALCIWHVQYNTWYNSIFVLGASLGLFVLMLRLLDGAKESTAIYNVSSAVFGCYIMHYLFIYMFNDFLARYFTINTIEFIGKVVFVSVTTGLSVFVLRQVRVIDRLLGLKM